MANLFQETTSQDFQTWVQQLAPTALTDSAGVLFEAAFASLKDLFADRVRLSLKARLPGLGAPDALTKLGVERGIPQGQTESGTAYAARLGDAWNAWPWAGTAFGILRALNATGYTNVALAQVRGGKVFTLDVNGNLFVTPLPTGFYETDALAAPLGPLWASFRWGDPNATYRSADQTFWSKFDVVFQMPLPASWISGGVPASSSSEATFIRALVTAWKPAHATNNRIIIIQSGRVWGLTPIDTWGSFLWTSGPLWNRFNWGPSSNYASGPTYGSAAFTQYGAAGLTWGGSNTTNWTGG